VCRRSNASRTPLEAVRHWLMAPRRRLCSWSLASKSSCLEWKRTSKVNLQSLWSSITLSCGSRTSVCRCCRLWTKLLIKTKTLWLPYQLLSTRPFLITSCGHLLMKSRSWRIHQSRHPMNKPIRMRWLCFPSNSSASYWTQSASQRVWCACSSFWEMRCPTISQLSYPLKKDNTLEL